MKLLFLLAIVVSCLPIAYGQEKKDDVCTKTPRTLNQNRKNGEIWTLDQKGKRFQCQCANVAFMGHMDMVPVCTLLGCSDDDWEFRHPGSVNAFGCACYDGPDPDMMDSYSLYHWNCSNSAETIKETCYAYGDKRYAVGEKWRDMNKRCVCNAKKCPKCSPQKSCVIDDSCDASPETLHKQRKYQEEWQIMKDGGPHECICGKVAMADDLESYPDCVPLGCLHENKFYKPQSKKNEECVCEKGSDPYYADRRMLYHWKCNYTTCKVGDKTYTLGDTWNETLLNNIEAMCECSKDIPSCDRCRPKKLCKIENPPRNDRNRCKRGKVSFSVGQTWSEQNKDYKAKCICLKKRFCKICRPKPLCIYEGCKKDGKFYPDQAISVPDRCMCVKQSSGQISWYEWQCN